jgi:glycerol-3-phosphate acyltransferase PlsY
VPVAAAHYGAGLAGWGLSLAALAPVLGNAFSPWLGGRGGKGLVVTFGVWSGLMLAQAPLVLGLGMVVFYGLLSVNAWAVILSLAGLLGFLLARRAEAPLLAVWAGNAAIVAWQHRRELRQAPRLRFSRPGRRRV